MEIEGTLKQTRFPFYFGGRGRNKCAFDGQVEGGEDWMALDCLSTTYCSSGKLSVMVVVFGCSQFEGYGSYPTCHTPPVRVFMDSEINSIGRHQTNQTMH